MTSIEGRVLQIEDMGYWHKPRFMAECRLGRIRDDNLWIKTECGNYVFEDHGKNLDLSAEAFDHIVTILDREKVIPTVEKYFTQGHPDYKSVDAVRARRGKGGFELYILREEE